MMNDALNAAETAITSKPGNAVLLPLEIQQEIFALLDPRALYAARKVCKWWRLASFDATVLTRQLRCLAINSRFGAPLCTPIDLEKLFVNASHTLLLGLHVRSARLDHFPPYFRRELPPSTLAATSNKRGDRTVTVDDGYITLFDSTQHPHSVLLRRRLNDLKNAIGSGPWSKVKPASVHCLALSSNGNLLAVGQDRTIQIYDLAADVDSFTINEYVSSHSGYTIHALTFELDDRVLRVSLSDSGGILYLGSPPQINGSRTDLMTHWRGDAGLRHTFLDSSSCTIPQPSGHNGSRVRITGIQLLRPYRRGFLFSAQRHGRNESSRYLLGHVTCSTANAAGILTVQPDSIVELARLESFLSALDYTSNAIRPTHESTWWVMPSAHEHHPHFVISLDGELLVLAEQYKKQIQAATMMHLFVYRLPVGKRLEQRLTDEDRYKGLMSQEIGSLETLQDRSDIPRIPICIGTIPGKVLEMRIDNTEHLSRRDEPQSVLTVVTNETCQAWSFHET